MNHHLRHSAGDDAECIGHHDLIQSGVIGTEMIHDQIGGAGVVVVSVVLNRRAVLVPEITERRLPGDHDVERQTMCGRIDLISGLSADYWCRLPLIAADGRRIVPRLAINVGACNHAGSSSANAGRVVAR